MKIIFQKFGGWHPPKLAGGKPHAWAILKIMRFDKKFCTFDIQFLIKFWLLTFSIMEILNPKVGTVPRKFEKYLWSTNRPAHFYRNGKSCLFWPPL